MRIVTAAVGKRMPSWISEGWNEYVRRMPADWPMLLHEIRAEPRGSGKTTAQLMAAEAGRIQAVLPDNAISVALDERGHSLTTANLAKQLKQWHEERKTLFLVIGGPDGLDPTFKRDADLRWRLSDMTLPHPLVRVVLAEQIYRAWAIIHNHPYHRE